MRFRVFPILFWLILLLAVGLRFYRLGQVPVALYWDETAILVDAKTVAQTGLDMHGRPWYQVIYPSYGDYKLPVYIWLAALGVKLGGVNEIALRLPSAILGVVTVLIGGLIARELSLSFDKKNKSATSFNQSVYQLMTMLVLAVSPWPMMFSRTGFEGNVGQALLAVAVWLLLKSRAKWWLVVPATLVGTLATYAYFSVRFVWPALVAGFCVLFILWPGLKQFKIKKFAIDGAIYLALPLIFFGLLLLPMMKSPLYGDMNNFRLSTSSVLNAYDYPLISNHLREQAGNTPLDRLIFHRHWLMLRELALNYADNLSLNFMFVTGDPNLRHGTGQFGLFVLPMILVLGLGLFTWFDKNKPVFLWLIGWWLIALLPASVPENTPHALRSLNALVPLALIMGSGWTALIEIYKSKLKGINRIIYRTFFFSYSVYTLLVSLTFIHFYFTQYPVDSADAWLDGYKQVALIAAQEKSTVDEIYIFGDDKLYLWLMAYGPYSAPVIQAWPSSGYQYSRFENIKFSQFGFTSQNSLTKKYLVIGSYESVKKSLEEYQLKPTWQQTVTSVDGKNKFLAIKLEP